MLAKSITRENTAFVAIGLLFIGLLCSKFLITLGTIVLLLSALCSKTAKEDWKQLGRHPALLALSGCFFVFVLGGLYTSNVADMLGRLRVLLPLLSIPLSLALLPGLQERAYRSLRLVFITLTCLAALGTVLNYCWNWTYYQELISVSKTIATPNKDHIRFSLLLCIAFFTSLQLSLEREEKSWRKFYLLAMGVLGVSLHILTVRSGLFALYVGVFITAIYYIIKSCQYLLGLGLMLTVLILPVGSYYVLPSFQQKVGLSIHTYTEWRAGRLQGAYSDMRRLISYEIALEVGNTSPVLGVGLGDLKEEMNWRYKRDHPQQLCLFPHNQYLSIFAGIGLLGLGLFMFLTMFPLFYQYNYRDLSFLLSFVVLNSSMLWENTLFGSNGVVLYALFLALPLSNKKRLALKD